MTDHAQRAKRIGCYVLPGGVTDPKKGLEQAQTAEAIGLGTVWIGERYDTKDLPSLAGAISALTTKVTIAAGITHQGLRHPMVLGSMGQTLQAISDNRFVMGFGRSASWRWRQYGAPAPTLQSMADMADILRRLWAGETVAYDGQLGTFPELRLAQRAAITPPPLLLAAVGPKTLELAGRSFDGVILHPFLTPDAVRRSMDRVRQAAKDAGRDPSSIRCTATVIVAPGRTDHDTAMAVGARAAGYFQLPGLGDSLAAANQWSPDDLAKYRSQPEFVALGARSADKALSREKLIELSRAMPESWLPSSSAIGPPAECAATLREYLAAGADDLILHGSTAEYLSPMIDAYVAQGGT